jgi:hypothetical protein
MKMQRPALIAAVGALAAGLSISAAVAAVSSSDDSVIHGCYAANGALRVIDEGKICKRTEKALDWNRAGAAQLPAPAKAYLLRRDHRYPVAEIPADGRPVTLESFDPEPAWYSMTVSASFETQGGPLTGRIACSAGGGSEEAYQGFGDEAEVTSPGGRLHFQWTLGTTGERPVEISCRAIDLKGEGTLTVPVYQMTLVQIEPQLVKP